MQRYHKDVDMYGVYGANAGFGSSAGIPPIQLNANRLNEILSDLRLKIKMLEIENKELEQENLELKERLLLI